MKKNILKVGILTIALVVPTLIFLNLKFFSHNHYKLPVFYPIDSIKADNGYKITSAFTIPEFSLLNQDSVVINSADFKNNILVINFIFTRCRTICPKITYQLSMIHDEFLKDTSVQMLSVTVDPQYDSPSVLKKYMNDKSINGSNWLFLTGSKDYIYNLAQKGFFISAMEDEEHPLDFIHSEKVVLVDQKGWIRGYYNGTDRKEVNRLSAEIKVLKAIDATDR